MARFQNSKEADESESALSDRLFCLERPGLPLFCFYHHSRIMGNQGSSPRRTDSPTSNYSSQPSPNKPLNHGQKRRSLDLPDLAALTDSPYRRYSPNPAHKTASIPIPTSPETVRQRTNEKTAFSNSNSKVPLQAYPPNGAEGSQPGTSVSTDQSWRQGTLTPAPPPSRNPSPSKSAEADGRMLVMSCLPAPVKAETPSVKPINITIRWNGGGNSVMLARAGDDDWKGRQPMHRLSPTSMTHSIEIPLLPGTHHLRFLVDDQWLVADDLPTAVDDQGSLANYVGVALDGVVTGGVVNVAEPAEDMSPTQQELAARVTFAGSSASASPSTPQRPRMTATPSFWSTTSSNGAEDGDDGSYRYAHQHGGRGAAAAAASGTPGAPPFRKSHPAKWTCEIPPELEEAAKLEDTYIQATNAQHDQSQHRASPGHRERGRDRATGHGRGGGTQVINGFIPAPQLPTAPGLPEQLNRLILNVNSYPRAVTANGTVVGATGGTKSSVRDREGRDREREGRDRDKDRRSRRDKGERHRKSLNLYPSPASDIDASPTSAPANGSATSSPLASPSISSPESAPASMPGDSFATPAASSTPTNPPTVPNKIIDDTVSADDTSVLPVPSHVVLHHLSTSAIRNGVLAVGATVRYKKKYLTTIYYKPT
ncbi:hypothetical protein C8J56DRAFT_977105 [Mycena floridula]|nr:hypothetical protein C8J56DRAFT_977105 [Mycena floridula]